MELCIINENGTEDIITLYEGKLALNKTFLKNLLLKVWEYFMSLFSNKAKTSVELDKLDLSIKNLEILCKNGKITSIANSFQATEIKNINNSNIDTVIKSKYIDPVDTFIRNALSGNFYFSDQYAMKDLNGILEEIFKHIGSTYTNNNDGSRTFNQTSYTFNNIYDALNFLKTRGKFLYDMRETMIKAANDIKKESKILDKLVFPEKDTTALKPQNYNKLNVSNILDNFVSYGTELAKTIYSFITTQINELKKLISQFSSGNTAVNIKQLPEPSEESQNAENMSTNTESFYYVYNSPMVNIV